MYSLTPVPPSAARQDGQCRWKTCEREVSTDTRSAVRQGSAGGYFFVISSDLCQRIRPRDTLAECVSADTSP